VSARANPVRSILEAYERDVISDIDAAAPEPGDAWAAETDSGFRARCLTTILEDPRVLDPPRALVARALFAARVTLLAAREKAGKSTLATAIAAAVTRGRPFLDSAAVAPGDVLWVGFEEHEPDLVQRLQAFRVDPPRFYLAGPAEIASIPELAREASRPGLVLIVIDSLSKVADREGVDEGGNSQKWSLLMSRITAIARGSGAAVLLLHHMKKDGGYRDSTSIGAGVDIIVEMDDGPPDDPKLRKLRPKGRINVAPFSIRYDPSEPAFMLAGDDLTRDARALACLAVNPGLSMSVLAAKIGGNRQATLATIRSLVSQGAIVKRGAESRSKLHVALPSGEEAFQELASTSAVESATEPVPGRSAHSSAPVPPDPTQFWHGNGSRDQAPEAITGNRLHDCCDAEADDTHRASVRTRENASRSGAASRGQEPNA
jgi:hypothetical protein